MRVKTDARFLINKKRQKMQTRRTAIDARKILNSKFSKATGKNTKHFSKVYAESTSQYSSLHRPVSSHKKDIFKRAFQTKAPEKQVKIEKDGNILVTARSKVLTDTASNILRSSQTKIQPGFQWTPSNVDFADVEHIGFTDVLDIDSLPSTVVRPINKFERGMPHQTLAQQIVGMQNTMIADRIASEHPMNVCVSNLHSSVSKQDIMELFGDIGLIKQVEMVQPGVALIEYFDRSNATRACEQYHNRLLDGQPMQCYIQQPSTQGSLISQRLGERVQSVSPFPVTSSVSSRSVYDPKNVKFTVKLM